MTAQTLPVGELVAPHPALKPDQQQLRGQHVRLEPLDVSHALALFPVLCAPGSTTFTYLPAGPFETLESFTEDIAAKSASQDPWYYAIILVQPLLGPGSGQPIPVGTPVGYISYLNIDLLNRCIEIGWVTFSPALQRTTAATETLYLLMKHAVEVLDNRRIEWKCDSKNAKSRRAAERLGFVYEGLFRNHKIVRGRNRDTVWYSVTDGEWEARDKEFQAWFSTHNFEAGKQIKSLDEVRRLSNVLNQKS